MDKLLTMSEKELSRWEVIQRVEENRLAQKEAGAMLGISARQIRRLLSRYRLAGASSLVSQRRGKASNHPFQGKYRGFGPTLACEKLVEVEGLKISDESVRQMMIGEGLRKARKHHWQLAIRWQGWTVRIVEIVILHAHCLAIS